MKTIPQLLALPPNELSAELGKMRERPWKHNWIRDVRRDWTGNNEKCCKCSIADNTPEAYSECPNPDPIPINSYDVAKEWQGKCDRIEYFKALYHVYFDVAYEDKFYRDFEKWVVIEAQPKYILIAAYMCLMKG